MKHAARTFRVWQTFGFISPAVLATAVLYGGGLGGYWLGDDFSFLYLVHDWSGRDDLLGQVLLHFLKGLPAEGGAFYRPWTLASYAISYVVSSDSYRGWYLFGYVFHLANVALVAIVSALLARQAGCTGWVGPALAGLAFGLSPLMVEGTAWVAARADLFVTLAMLLSLAILAEERLSTTQKTLLVGAALLLGLASKESAAILPAQLAVIAIAGYRPNKTSCCQPVVVAFLVVAAYAGLRLIMFESAPWQVYPPDSWAIPWSTRLATGLGSIAPWWGGLMAESPNASRGYPLLAALGIALLVRSADRRQASLALGLALAALLQVCASLANLGALVPSGEGGRHAYGPMALLAVGLGALASHRPALIGGTAQRAEIRYIGLALLAGAVVIGAIAATEVTRHVWKVQASVRALAAGIPSWVTANPGRTILFVPDSDGPVVALRNGQGALVTPPIQSSFMLDRIVPTLPTELSLRFTQVADGTLGSPQRAACWHSRDGRIAPLPLPEMFNRDEWVENLRQSLERCGL